ncbi:hypothetical conserved protein [Oceanobacillus iheyensis HTE831]|uniref:Hypothetical conserved protein n=1 Tax=Oceanobacillus iheyensis (strain DSM 14371 / CIP 107618 / JCM 11309 / KCTC 3954 / HTE831) TaxID=221109 RepID=Q8ERH8_OCEIH|nr:DUF4176 domain-containing protein [Oceanobacillus iheyensis]BAC13280.1 hypothetical conserved protein [Oceanobacillus iheyensis HTE831]
MLPIRSIVYLKEGTSKLMILNRAPILPTENEEQKGVMYDYSGCIYPQGLDPNNVLYFNEENIDKVVSEGYKDEEEERFQEIYDSWMKENGNTFKKGTVSGPLK